MKTSLYLGIILTLSAIALLPSCNHNDEEGDFRENCKEMAPGDICVVDDEFSIRFVQVFSESRCPLSVVCVWEGQAEIELEYLINDMVVKTDTLNVRPGIPEAGVGQYEQYHVELKELIPYPQEPGEIKQEDYRLSIHVSEDWFQANITGVNPTLCPTLCCAGYHIEIGGNLYTNYNYFDLSGEDPGIATFPIPIEIRYKHDILFPCHVVLTELKN